MLSIRQSRLQGGSDVTLIHTYIICDVLQQLSSETPPSPRDLLWAGLPLVGCCDQSPREALKELRGL